MCFCRWHCSLNIERRERERREREREEREGLGWAGNVLFDVVTVLGLSAPAYLFGAHRTINTVQKCTENTMESY